LRIDENEASSCLCIDCWRSSSRFLIHVLIIGIIIYFCSLYIYNRFPGCCPPPLFLYLIMYNIVSYRRQQQQYRENIRKRAIKGGGEPAAVRHCCILSIIDILYIVIDGSFLATALLCIGLAYYIEMRWILCTERGSSNLYL
jgi:hypothetical protein